MIKWYENKLYWGVTQCPLILQENPKEGNWIITIYSLLRTWGHHPGRDLFPNARHDHFDPKKNDLLLRENLLVIEDLHGNVAQKDEHLLDTITCEYVPQE